MGLTKSGKSWYNDSDMNKLIPFAKFSKKAERLHLLSNTSIIINEKGTPLGFVFGTDAFVSFLEYMDEEFEKKVDDPRKAFNNPAGRLIDLIEERLLVNPDFIKELKKSVASIKKSDWIPFDEVLKSLNV